jgi:glucan phosphoethanolaminetransferase (alkaline phosphatase superfamily)
MMSVLLLILIIIVIISILIAWIISECRNSKRWIRITLGSFAILCLWGVAVIAAQIVRLNYNIWYSDATKKLIIATVDKLEAGKSVLVKEKLIKLQDQLRPSYEYKGNYDELVEEAVRDMKKPSKTK